MLDDDQINYFRDAFGDGVPPTPPIRADVPVPPPMPALPKPLSDTE